MSNNIYIEKLKLWRKLWRSNRLDSEKINEFVDFFTNSSLPNSWFLQQFSAHADTNFYYKCNWELLTRVLVTRGMEKLGEDAITLLKYLYEPYYDSHKVIRQFVLENYNIYNLLIKKVITNLKKNDDYLLVQDIVESLCDDNMFKDKKYDRLCELFEDVYEKSFCYEKVVDEAYEIATYLLDKYLLKLDDLPKYY